MNFTNQFQRRFVLGILILIIASMMLIPAGTIAAQDEPLFAENDCDCEDLGWKTSADHSRYTDSASYEWLQKDFGFSASELHCEYAKGKGYEPRLSLSIIHTQTPEQTEELANYYLAQASKTADFYAQKEGYNVIDHDESEVSRYSHLSVHNDTRSGLYYYGYRAILHPDNFLVVVSGWGYEADFKSKEDFKIAFDRLEQHAMALLGDKQEEKTEGTITGFDIGMSRMHLSLLHQDEMMVTTTNAYGRYEFPVKLEKDEEYELTLHFEYVREGKTVFRIRFQDNAIPAKIVLQIKGDNITQAWLDLGGNMYGELPVSHISLSELKLDELLNSEEFASLVSMYIHFSEALAFYTDGLGVKLNFQLPIEVHAFTDPESEPTAYNYALGMSWINIDEAKSYHSSPYRPIHREYHEFSHYVMHALYGALPVPKNPPVPEINHGGYANPSTSDSFVEGFAIFMSIMMANSLGDTIPHPPVRLMELMTSGRAEMLRDLEPDYLAWEKNGKAEEVAVAAVLWDLVDSAQDYRAPEDEAFRRETIETMVDSALQQNDVNNNGQIERDEWIAHIFFMRAQDYTEDGALDWNEWNSVTQDRADQLKKGEPLPDADELNTYVDNEILGVYDLNGDRTLQFAELKELQMALSGSAASVNDTLLQEIFRKLDADASNGLAGKELLKLAVTDLQPNRIWETYDTDRDEKISKAELIQMAPIEWKWMQHQESSVTDYPNLPQVISSDYLWQATTPQDDDIVSISFEKIWGILSQYHQDFTAVYQSLINTYPDQKDGIDQIFKAHGFFADVNPQNQKWDSGEAIGRAADASTEDRKQRRSTQELPGQFIKVNNEVPYYNVAVLFPLQPHLSYLARTANTGGWVYVQIPPEAYLAQITVAAEGVQSNNPLTFTTPQFNAAYEESLAQGYFVTHDFGIVGDIPALPAFPFDDADAAGTSKDESAETESDGGSNAAFIGVLAIIVVALVIGTYWFIRRK
ncbi:MAG: hypothetical protein PHV74_04670 [Dehalococcoidia bacterium]|nr:hypothetical protein [Dehalococcoidia bacterium]